MCLIVARAGQAEPYYRALDRAPYHLDQREWDNVAAAAEVETDSGYDFGAVVE